MSKPIRWLTRSATLASLGVAGGAFAVTARHLLATPQPLESRLFGESQIDRRSEGDIFYNVSGPAGAEPVVLLHDFYPGASNDEFRRIYPRLAPDYRVYAPDWLGFGLSERPALAYTGEFYASLLIGFLRDTVQRPATVIASGLAGNIVVRAATDAPELFARLVLVEPRPLADTLTGPTTTQTLLRTLQRASLGLVPYALLSTRTALRWQIRRHAAYAGEGAATDDVLDHVYASAHQFGGHHALLALLTGELDLPVENALPSLQPPVLIVGGAGDGSRSLAALQDLALLNPQARLLTIPESGPAVHEDQPAALMQQLGTWLQTPPSRSTPRITESRATARTFAGAIRVDREITPGTGTGADSPATSQPPVSLHAQETVADVSATSAAATPSAGVSAAPAVPHEPSVSTDLAAHDSAPATPSRAPAADDSAAAPSGTSMPASPLTQAHAPASDTAASDQLDVAPDLPLREQFDEPHGVVSPTPGLEGLGGLAERLPDAEWIDDGYDLIPEARPLPTDDDSAHIVGKLSGELDASASVSGEPEESTATPGTDAQTAQTQPDLTAIRRKGRSSSSVTRANSHPSEPASHASSGPARQGATDASKRGGTNSQRDEPIPGGRKHGPHRHKHGHH